MKKGTTSPRKGKTYEEIYGKETADKMRKGLKEREFTWGDKISKTKKGVPNPKVSKSLRKGFAEGKIKSWLENKTWEEAVGEERAKEIKLNNSIKHTGKIGWNNGLTKETDERVRKNTENCIFKDPNFRVKYKDNIQIGLIRKPSSYEHRISQLCIENNLPFIYTGDGTFLIGNKNPDFINEEKRIAIEVYDSYFKIKKHGTIENYKKQRIEEFNSYGWRIIFLDEKDIKHKDYKNICLNKIKETL